MPSIFAKDCVLEVSLNSLYYFVLCRRILLDWVFELYSR